MQKLTMAFHCHAILSSLLLAASIYVVRATDYTVGGDSQWATGINYLAWSTKYNFTVGDALIFNYVKGQHNVYEVTEDSFRSCDATNGTLQIYDSGMDTVNLTTAKKYWFLCNIVDHCKGGMKFTINVSSAPAPPPAQPPPIESTPPPPPSAAIRSGIDWSYCAILLVSFCLSGVFLFTDLDFSL